MFKMFGETFFGGSFIWYLLFTEDYIDSFNMLTFYFAKVLFGLKKMQPCRIEIFKIEQSNSKLLWYFVPRFRGMDDVSSDTK